MRFGAYQMLKNGVDWWMHLRRDTIRVEESAGEAPVRLTCNGDLCLAKTLSSLKASRAKLRTRIGFVRLPHVAELICFSKMRKIRTRSISRLRRWTIRHRLRRRKRSSSKTNCRGLNSTSRFRRFRKLRRLPKQAADPPLLKLRRDRWLTRRTRIGSLMAEGQQIHDDFALVMAGMRCHRPGEDPKNC